MAIQKVRERERDLVNPNVDIRQSAKDENGNISGLSVAQLHEVDEPEADLSSLRRSFLTSFFPSLLFNNNGRGKRALF